jgi:hypothetical protein
VHHNALTTYPRGTHELPDLEEWLDLWRVIDAWPTLELRVRGAILDLLDGADGNAYGASGRAGEGQGGPVPSSVVQDAAACEPEAPAAT